MNSEGELGLGNKKETFILEQIDTEAIGVTLFDDVEVCLGFCRTYLYSSGQLYGCGEEYDGKHSSTVFTKMEVEK
jgi:hypothetical protein